VLVLGGLRGRLGQRSGAKGQGEDSCKKRGRSFQA
jgi:hypothetical protein